MSQEVTFSVEVSNIDCMYGITLEMNDPEAEPGIEKPIYFLVFEGAPEKDIQEIANIFSVKHKDCMNEVGIGGEMEEEIFAHKFFQSIELACDKMEETGLIAQDVRSLDPKMVDELFNGSKSDGPEYITWDGMSHKVSTDPNKLLN